MTALIIILFILLWLFWNVSLVGYRDRETSPIAPLVDDVFDARCLPIILEHEEVVQGAVLMVHGFPSTPYSYEEASIAVHEAGYDVFVPLLPGFGTDPKDLKHTTYTQWYAYLRDFYLEKRNHYPRLYVIGTSMGGAMTLDLASEFSGTDDAPDGIVTVAAPIYLNNLREGFAMNPLSYLGRTVALFTSSFKTDIYHGAEEANDGDENWIGYKGVFVTAGVSLIGALKRIRHSLIKVTVPILCIHDTGDRTIHYKNQRLILSGVSSEMKRSITTSMDATHRKHILLMYDSSRDQLIQSILEFFEETAEQEEKES